MRLEVCVLAMLLAVSLSARSNTIAPAGPGQASAWVKPCELFVAQAGKPDKLNADEQVGAAMCQGIFTGLAAVNYIDPPWLPFCERETDTPLEYARIFLAFMRVNPTFGNRQLGIVLMVALSKARPKEQCTK